MQWAVGRLLAVPLWLFALVVAAYMFVIRIAEYIGRRLGVINSDGSGVGFDAIGVAASPLPLCVSHCAQDWERSQQVQR